jgi:hypothetical protein
LRVSLLPTTRISRDRNPPPSFTAHGTEIKFASDRISKLLHIRGVGHGPCLHQTNSALKQLVQLNSQVLRPGDIVFAERMILLARQGSKQGNRKLLRDEGQ